MELNVEQETVRELASRKQNLLLELKNYEANQKQKGGRGVAPVAVAGEEEVGRLGGGEGALVRHAR